MLLVFPNRGAEGKGGSDPQAYLELCVLSAGLNTSVRKTCHSMMMIGDLALRFLSGEEMVGEVRRRCDLVARESAQAVAWASRRLRRPVRIQHGAQESDSTMHFVQ